MDTKWKLFDETLNNCTDKYGLSQADFCQMFAYGQKYKGGRGKLVLICPKHDGFKKPIEHSFDFDEELRLWMVPFDIIIPQYRASPILSETDGKRYEKYI